MEKERMRRIPVEVDDDGFSIDENRLNTYMKDNLDELKEHASDHREIPKTRLFIGSVIGFFILLAILALAMRGGLIFAFLLMAITLFNLGPMLKWVEGKK